MQPPPPAIAFTIVICTWNPDERLLRRCLDAVAQLDVRDIPVEVILVDNNSHRPLHELAFVKSYLAAQLNWQTLLVDRQGVQNARMAAIEKARGACIVYFDHDNEPAPDYLQQLKQLQWQHPEVAAWGPGKITIDFVDGIAPALETYARRTFQEKKARQTRFASLPTWQDCYPFGAGLCTRTDLLKEYAQLARQGRFTLAGRHLTGGEDRQMVLFCIRRGHAAGNSPTLQLTRIITGRRANTTYLKRLAYGTSLCYPTCLLQVYPEQRMLLRLQRLPGGSFSRQAIEKAVINTFRRSPQHQFEMATWLGQQAGVWRALKKPLPLPVRAVIRYLKLH